ncbi:hypothetical protein QR685DRAFT_575608 [Neurospora intermedia]|uniref:Uncharacterized protein n=1 Tax=Neurospora intermedia TaxID=5142 RepID=A0ABR3CZY0_NEUIN
MMEGCGTEFCNNASIQTQQGMSGFPVASDVWVQTSNQCRSLNSDLLHDKHLRTSSEIMVNSIDVKGTKSNQEHISTDADHDQPRLKQETMPMWAIMGVLAPPPRLEATH